MKTFLWAVVVTWVVLYFGGFSKLQAQGNPVNCFEAGRQNTSLDNGQIMRLCCRQNSVAPVNCFQSSHQSTALSDDQLVSLCACTGNDGPVACYDKARNDTTLSSQEALAMCESNGGNYFYPTFPSFPSVPMATPGPWQSVGQ